MPRRRCARVYSFAPHEMISMTILMLQLLGFSPPLIAGASPAPPPIHLSFSARGCIICRDNMMPLKLPDALPVAEMMRSFAPGRAARKPRGRDARLMLWACSWRRRSASPNFANVYAAVPPLIAYLSLVGTPNIIVVEEGAQRHITARGALKSAHSAGGAQGASPTHAGYFSTARADIQATER